MTTHVETATCHVISGRKPEPRAREAQGALSDRIIHPCNLRQPHHLPLLLIPNRQIHRPRPHPRSRPYLINLRGRRLARTRSDDSVPIAAVIPSRGGRPSRNLGFLRRAGERSGRWSGRAHGGGGTRRRIGGEGRRLGRGPGGEMGLARHPAAALLRLHLHLLRSRGCFGCCEEAVKQVGELSKSLMAHAQNPTVGEEFWSTTTIEVDPADLRVSSIHPSSWDLDQHGVGSSHNPAESANHGFSLWKQTRDEWTDNVRQQPVVKQIQEPVLSWNAAYESLLGSNKPFPQPIPLHEMVDFLVDIWEQEGLYD